MDGFSHCGSAGCIWRSFTAWNFIYSHLKQNESMYQACGYAYCLTENGVKTVRLLNDTFPRRDSSCQIIFSVVILTGFRQLLWKYANKIICSHKSSSRRGGLKGNSKFWLRVKKDLVNTEGPKWRPEGPIKFFRDFSHYPKIQPKAPLFELSVTHSN